MKDEAASIPKRALFWYTCGKHGERRSVVVGVNGGNVKRRLVMVAQAHWRRGFILGLLTAVALFLSACSLISRTPALGDTIELQGSATVICSAACAERGQCGSMTDGSQAVLGGSLGPTVAEHDRRFSSGSFVNIMESRLQTVELVAPTEPTAPFDLRFYHIQLLDQPDAWVAGWCLSENTP